MTHLRLEVRVPRELGSKRLDQIAAELFPDYSRSQHQRWIASGELRVDGEERRAKDKLRGGEILAVVAELEERQVDEAQDLGLEIVFEDDDVLVVDKPAGLVVHPGAGNRDATLLNALLHHDPALREVPRAGIVHRLDKGTTGLLVVAKNLRAQHRLAESMQAHGIERQYEAVVYGRVRAPGVVDAPIGRHPARRTRMAVVEEGKPARTHYRVVGSYEAHTHLALRLETGRTHQIRVHMSSISHPLVGDPLYGGTFRLPPGHREHLVAVLKGFGRPALHAVKLAFPHPVTGAALTFESPLPPDFAGLVAALEAGA